MVAPEKSGFALDDFPEIRMTRAIPEVDGAIRRVVWITPGLAEVMLAYNVSNRQIKKLRLPNYVRDMQSGNWRYADDPIRFDWNGHLLDGQHRLTAIVMSGQTIAMPVVEGLDPAVWAVIDRGIPRTEADTLTHTGEKNAKLLASVVRLTLLYSDGRLAANQRAEQETLSPREYSEWLECNPELREAVDKTYNLAKKIGMKQSVLATAFWIQDDVDRAANREFMDRLDTMVGLERGDPIIALLRRLRSASANRERVLQRQQLNLELRTWDHWRKGHKLTKAAMPAVGDPLPKL